MNKTDLFEAVIELLQREALSLRQFQHQLIRYQYNKFLDEDLVQQHAVEQTARFFTIGDTTVKRILKEK